MLLMEFVKFLSLEKFTKNVLILEYFIDQTHDTEYDEYKKFTNVMARIFNLHREFVSIRLFLCILKFLYANNK